MHTLSNKSKYALKALLALAKHAGGAPVQIAGLARQEQIPQKFLEAILLELKNNGLLQSRKGKGGGYALARSPEAISVGDVIRVLDGPLAQVPCVSHSAHRTCTECEDESTGGIRSIMSDVREATAAILDKESLSDLLRRTEALRQRKQKVLVYAI